MHCPFCSNDETKVIDSRLVAEGAQVRRRRECLHCGERFTTYEAAELVLPRIIKQDGSREPFDEEKLRSGLLRALEKRPVSVESIEAELDQIKHRLRATGEREIKSLQVGEVLKTPIDRSEPHIGNLVQRFQRLHHRLAEFRDAIESLEAEPAEGDSP